MPPKKILFCIQQKQNMIETGALIAIISVSFSGAASLLHSCFMSMSLSRCTRIKVCCIECDRDVLDKDELEDVLEATENNAEPK